MDFNFRFCSESTSEGLISEFEKILDSHKVDYKVEWNLSGLPFLTTKTFFVDLVIFHIIWFVAFLLSNKNRRKRFCRPTT